MKKKLIVAAVAGALTAPAVALAQSSTVSIYGLLNVEYGPYVKNIDHPSGVGRNTTDELNSGASRIGFRGEEKLGGGLSAWFQCETDLQFLDGGTDGGEPYLDSNSLNTPAWCDRNSALGLKGGWGNFYIGTWDSPAKRVTSATRMLNETGWFGAQRLLMTHAGWGYSHRVTKSLNYDTPNFGGFSMAVQVTTENAARNSLESTSGHEARIWGVNGMYTSGPLVVGLAYQKYENQIQFATPPFPVTQAIDGRDDQVFVAGINYTFGMFKLGFIYTQIEVERGTVIAPADSERKNVNLALDWDIAGPGLVRFGFTQAGKTEIAGPCSTCGSARQYQISYNHSFSKRTTGTVGWVMLDNGSGGHYNLHGLASGPGNVRAGDKAQAVALGLQHTF